MKWVPWIGSVRSIATLGIVGTFCGLAAAGRVDPKDFVSVVTVVVGFYYMAKDRSK